MRLLLTCMLVTILATPALAYKPHVGDRAADIRGRDAVSDTVVSLLSYSGNWVFIDFWAAWCGPCMREMPNFLAETKPWVKSGDLKLFSVSLDNPNTDLRMNEDIRKFGITYPVIFDNGGWNSVQAKEWGVNSIPATFLLDPQMNIAATNLRGATLGPALEFFLGGDGYSPIGIRSSNTVGDDGNVDVMLELSSASHAPLSVKVDYYHTRYTYAEDDPEHEGRPVKADYIEMNEDGPEQEFEVEFGMFGEKVVEFTIMPVEDTHQLSYTISVMLPGTEELMGGEGIWVSERGRVKFE